MKTISVCIVNYNTRDLLRDCLRSVMRDTPDEIIVVDNASTDGSVEMVKGEFPSVRLLRSKVNLGYGAAANRAIGSCQSDYVLLLNSDTQLKPGCLPALRDYLDKNPSTAIAGPRISNPDGTPQTSTFYYPTPAHIFLYLSGIYQAIIYLPVLRKRSLQATPALSTRVVPWVVGAAFAFRREDFESVRGFDEEFFMYFEEVDLCYRLVKNGKQIHYAPVGEIIHVGGASTGKRQVEMNVMYFSSLARFYRKHYSWTRLFVLMVMVRFFALIHLVRNTLLQLIVRDEANRKKVAMNLQVNRKLLLDRWSDAGNTRKAVENVLT
ncbi:MAG: glycosyltransferase family 2 protein [Candidatus Methanosuratincola sp.]